MGHVSILLDEMGLDKIGLDEIGINLKAHYQKFLTDYNLRKLTSVITCYIIMHT